MPDVPNSEFLGWQHEVVGGHKAVRMDFEPRPNLALNKLGSHPRAVISVFLLPLESTDFSESFLEELEGGHACERCIRFDKEGTIYCLRKSDLFVAAVSNTQGFGVR